MRSVETAQEEERSDPARRRFPVPRSRALVCDLLALEKSLPTVAHFREFDLGPLKRARDACEVKISWPLLFIKAYGIVAARHPNLRQAWIPYPFPYLYQHPHSVGTVTIKRTHEGEEWLMFGCFEKPEETDLEALQNRLDSYRTEPIDSVFKRFYDSTKLPTWIRRSIMWIWLNWIGERRARKFGTFGLTTVGSRGTVIQNPPGMLTSTLTYGPMDESGGCRVSISYDHRIMDGWYIAEILEELEATMNGEIAEELQAM